MITVWQKIIYSGGKEKEIETAGLFRILEVYFLLFNISSFFLCLAFRRGAFVWTKDALASQLSFSG